VPSNMRLAAVMGLSAMTIAAGCATAAPGNPSPPSSLGEPTNSMSAGVRPSSKPSLPPRPRDIALNGVDPCALWTTRQLTELALIPNPRKSVTTAGDDICHFDALDPEPPEITMSVSAVLDHDANDVFLPSHGDAVVEVAGFPAVRQPADAAGPRPCTVAVSTTKGQFLEIVLSYASTQAHLSGEQACELTTKAATFAMQTLQTQR